MRSLPRANCTEYFLTPNSSPESITVGPDGRLWFSEPGFDTVGRITTSGNLTEFASNGITGQTAGIARGRTATCGSPRTTARWAGSRPAVS